MAEQQMCRRCDRPVRVSRADYETFERMHYVCFHYEFEHDPADPDEECTAGGCPSGALNTSEECDRLIATVRRLLSEWRDGPPPWENDTLPRYLEAFAAWLDDRDGYYANRGSVTPTNGWRVVADALQAAVVYE